MLCSVGLSSHIPNTKLKQSIHINTLPNSILQIYHPKYKIPKFPMRNTKCLSAMQSRARFQLCKAWPSSPFLFRKIETTFQISLNAQCPQNQPLNNPDTLFTRTILRMGRVFKLKWTLLTYWCADNDALMLMKFLKSHPLTHSVSDKVVY